MTAQALTYEEARRPQSRQHRRAPVSVESGSPYLTTAEACVRLRYTGTHRLKSLYRFIKAKGLNVTHRSARCLLIKRADLDAAIGER